MLDTWTRLHFSIFASRSASSKERSSSLWVPTPFVKNSLFGTNKGCISSPPSSKPALNGLSVFGQQGITHQFIQQLSPKKIGCDLSGNGTQLYRIKADDRTLPGHAV